MLSDKDVFEQDMQRIATDDAIAWGLLQGKTVFITGATGLIGQTIVRALLFRNWMFGSGIRILALVRDVQKGRALFGDMCNAAIYLAYIEGNLESFPQVSEPIDYIIHCACPTESSFFANRPVDTAWIILEGTKKVLDLALEKNATNTVFLSSMEVYGIVYSEKELKETDLGELDIRSPRNSYPLAKRMAENMCCGFSKQYNIKTTVCRLAQTFGPGVRYEDKRVFAYMARCACTGSDIRLNTSGSKKNMYVYTADAAAAVLLLLLQGDYAEIYNVANPSTYCSVREMGELVANSIGKGKIIVETNVGKKTGLYPPDGFLKLNVSKLMALGWHPTVDLEEMHKRMISAFVITVGRENA